MKNYLKLLAPVPFRIHSVQRERLNDQNIRINRTFRPGGINFAGGHIFNVILVADPVVAGGGIAGDSVMHDDIFGDYHPA